MNLCKIGIHDYEVRRDTTLVKKFLTDYLISKGFILNKHKRECYWSKDEVIILDWDYVMFEDSVESCYDTPETKVCIRCGKIKQNYNLDTCLIKLFTLIKEKKLELHRKEKAKNLLAKANI